MVIVGAGGHAKEVLDVIYQHEFSGDIYFFDDITPHMPSSIFNNFPILRSLDEIKEIFKVDPDFAIGVGIPALRFKLCEKMQNIGGTLQYVISTQAIIGKFDVVLGAGLNIMHKAMISSNCRIGEGSLINAGAQVHHDGRIGRFSEISPGVVITGGCSIGDFSSIGAGAVVLPKIKIGNYVVVGAGAVVNKDVEDHTQVVGVPARVVKKFNL
jgi:sugar O-acyltransferase (sialic acid O-acetyltransferase NeuD family)